MSLQSRQKKNTTTPTPFTLRLGSATEYPIPKKINLTSQACIILQILYLY